MDPTFPDYLVLSFNTALAFSPTDVSAVRVWAKLMMVFESMVSLALAALAIARAINATAVVGVGVLQELVPDDFRVLPRHVYPIVLLCFLAVLVLGDPGRIDRQRRWLRVTTLLMFGLITLATASAAVRLVDGIFTDARFTAAANR